MAQRLTIETSEGAFTVELYPDLAPQTVARFLERAGLAGETGGTTSVRYGLTQVCELRAHGFVVFGCVPPTDEWPRPRPSGFEPPLPDEIDGRAMGLDGRSLGDERDRDLLWQLEIYPRYRRLAAAGREIPPGLEALMAGVRERGMAATAALRDRSRLWYLEALGYRFTEGASPLRVVRGALATASRFPDEADERFLIPYVDIPKRDGRATVFGRVVSGWETLEAIARLPVDKSHVPLRPVKIERVSAVPARAPKDGSESDS